MTPPTPPTPTYSGSFWAHWGPNHLEAICGGVIAGAWVAARFGLGTIAVVAAAVAVGSWLVRHLVKS